MPKCHATNILSEKLALRNIAPEYPQEIFNKHFPTCFLFGSATLHIEGLPAQLAGRPFSAASRPVDHTNPAFLALKGGERALKGHETGSEKEKMPASDTSQTTSIEGTAALMDRQQDSCHPKIFKLGQVEENIAQMAKFFQCFFRNSKAILLKIAKLQSPKKL